MFDHFLVHFGPEDVRRVGVARGETLYLTLERNGLPIRTSCRGSATCGRCWVRVLSDIDTLPEVERDERMLLDRYAGGETNARLACKLSLPQGRAWLEVEVPVDG